MKIFCLNPRESSLLYPWSSASTYSEASSGIEDQSFFLCPPVRDHWGSFRWPRVRGFCLRWLGSHHMYFQGFHLPCWHGTSRWRGQYPVLEGSNFKHHLGKLFPFFPFLNWWAWLELQKAVRWSQGPYLWIMLDPTRLQYAGPPPGAFDLPQPL